MDFFKTVEERHSMRKFKDTPVEEEKLHKILNTANKAPSAGNLQGFEIYIVRKPEQRKALGKAAYDQESLVEAPVVLVFCANPDCSAEQYQERGSGLYCIQDAAIACSFAMLAAKALGLDTVWVGAFDENEVGKVIHVPGKLRPVSMLPIGYAGKEAMIRPRRELKDLVHEA
jgi:nitroreductase